MCKQNNNRHLYRCPGLRLAAPLHIGITSNPPNESLPLPRVRVFFE